MRSAPCERLKFASLRLKFESHRSQTLQACSEAWSQLLTQEGAPKLQEAIQVRYQRLCGKLMQATTALATTFPMFSLPI